MKPTRKPRRVEAAVSPPTSTPSGTRSGGLPPDVLVQVCKRIGIMSIVFAAMWAIAIFINSVVHDLLHHVRMDMMGLEAVWPMPGNLVAGIAIALSGVMIVLARKYSATPRTLLRIGLVYEVLNAALISFLFYWKPMIRSGGVSWICIVILVYPSIVPSTPRSTFVAGLLAFLTEPVFLLLALARGETVQTDAFGLIWHFLPTFICVFLSTIPAKLIAGLGRQVSKARELGAYQIGELIGRGGMGEVYRARHRFLARPAAIKLIRPETLGNTPGGDRNVLRFRREAQAAASLRSPHTISLYDFGVTDDGVFYYVMELLEGVDLDTLVRRFGPVSPARAVYLLRHACRSLAEAHARGMVHRDVKPSNIHTCRLGLSVDFVKVLDFGLVKTKMTGTHEETLLTNPDVTTGTPAFMAPEMALGEADVDHRADIYALGCVGYWLLTGHLVFEAESPVKMMLQHIQNDPSPPSKRSELDVPEALDRVILACLAKKPGDRPANAHDLEQMLAAIPVVDGWTKERAEAWWDRHLPTAAPMSSLRPETPLATMHVAKADLGLEDTDAAPVALGETDGRA